jgi:hypothetical protein
MRHICTIANANDMVSRLSLRSIRMLKDKVDACFKAAVASKWQIYR